MEPFAVPSKLKIVSWNVNGIRACANKGFLEYLETESPDILCLQETKIHDPEILEEPIRNPSGYHTIFHSGIRKGYSGVAIYTKHKPTAVLEGLGIERFDKEGRVVMAEFNNTCVFSVYFPNGQMNEERLQYKLDFFDAFFGFCEAQRAEGKNLIILGDYNIAHTEIDLANPKENEKYSGFLPIERAWMDRIVQMGYVDTFRDKFPGLEKAYSWWTYRFGSRARNVGWRIDYCFVNKEIADRVKTAFIQPEITGSDHCPVGITYDF